MKRFTVVFEGDIRKLPFNPMTKESEWGKVIAVSVGDALSTLGLIEEELNEDMPSVDRIFRVNEEMYD